MKKSELKEEPKDTRKRRIRVKLFDTLVEKNFSLVYVKSGLRGSGEGAEFRVEGKLRTKLDRKKAAAFIALAVSNPSLAENAHFIESPKLKETGISSAMVDDELAGMYNDYDYEEGFRDWRDQ